LLGYQPYAGRFARTKDDPLDADWVLVDEASMVDVFLLAALVRALPEQARLMLVGDADQLPPVEAGSVLGELLPADPDGGAGIVPSVRLDKGHRASDAITPLVAALLAGDADKTLALLNDPIEPAAAFFADVPVGRLDPMRGAASVAEALHAYADAAFLRRKAGKKTYAEWLSTFRRTPREEEAEVVKTLWDFVAATRVLAPLRRGTFSAANANRILRARLETPWGQRHDAPGTGFHGAPILITRNDRSTGLSNGEIGLWLEAAGGATAFFSRPELPGGWLRLPVALLPSCELGFASTVHKAQGSECDEVLILLPEPGNALLARETLYTAVTRARKAVRVFGSEAAIRQAVERRMRRYGGLREIMKREE
jgi:exodeoxyribonuclease V alpha subunit